jgi:hypothetical protein
MIKKFTIFALFFMFPAITLCGESFVEKEFEVKSEPSVVSKWLKEHPQEVAEATGSELISKKGDKVRVKKDTPKGMIDFTSRETSSDNGKIYKYKSQLIQVHEGPIEDQTTVVTLEKVRGGTKITIKMTARVSDTGAPAIRTGLVKSVRGFIDMVESKF